MAGSIHKGSEVRGNLRLACDVVVVGSGASGAVVAAELAEAGQSVVLLEEGKNISGERHGKMRRSESLRHIWRDGGTTVAFGLGGGPTINVSMGRAVGGSSIITGGVCFRTPDHILNRWVEEHGLRDLSPEGLAPCFEEVEEQIHVEEVPTRLRSRSTEIFDRGAREMGYALEPNRRNTNGCCGCSRCNFGCPHGAKLSVQLTYLPRAIRAGTNIYSECRVDKILTKGSKAIGVRGRLLNGKGGKAGGRLKVEARRVVLAAGAAHTPLLLLDSRVGLSSGQVGHNMTLHPSCRTFARFEENIRGWRGALQSAHSDHFLSEGITLMSIFVPPSIFAAMTPGAGPGHLERVQVLPHLSMFGGMVHDDGGGRVRRGPGREPIMTYRMSPRDRGRLSSLLRRLAQTYFAAGAREVYLPIMGHEPLDADAFNRLDLDAIPSRHFEVGSQHPMGTCRMGIDRNRSVVDPEGQTWDLEELFIVDGSIVPTSLGVNPQVSIMAMALRIAQKLRERPLPEG